MCLCVAVICAGLSWGCACLARRGTVGPHGTPQADAVLWVRLLAMVEPFRPLATSELDDLIKRSKLCTYDAGEVSPSPPLDLTRDSRRGVNLGDKPFACLSPLSRVAPPDNVDLLQDQR